MQVQVLSSVFLGRKMTVKELKKVLEKLPNDAVVCKKIFGGELLEIEIIEEKPREMYYRNRLLNQNRKVVVIEQG